MGVEAARIVRTTSTVLFRQNVVLKKKFFCSDEKPCFFETFGSQININYLFVTSLKCYKKDREPFNGVLFLLHYFKKTISVFAFHFKGFKRHFAAL